MPSDTLTQHAYAVEDVERLLQTAAAFGSVRRAARELGIPERTAHDWASSRHADRYQEIRAELAPKIQQQVAAQTEDLARELAEAEMEAAQQARKGIPDLNGKDASIAVKNLAIAQQNATNSFLLLRGQPTQITEKRGPEEIMAALKQEGIVVVLEGTAEEISNTEQAVEVPAICGEPHEPIAYG